MPQISVVIPIYNVEKYLTDCLDSICNQTFKDIEIICVNDGSTDSSLSILQNYAQKEPRIVIINQENKGLSGARNAGIKKATGFYTIFVDSDDRLPNFALQTLMNIANITKAPIVMSTQMATKNVIWTGGSDYQLHNNVMADFVANRHIFSSACNKIYQTQLIKDHPFIEGIYFEDWPFLTTLMGMIQKFATTHIPCYIYREDNESITRSSFNTKKIDSYITGINYVYQFFQNRSDLPLAQKRMAVAAKMLINKVYRTHNKNLFSYTRDQLGSLFEKGVIRKRDLPIKTLLRYWFMQI